MPVKGTYLAVAGMGAIVLYAGFKGKGLQDTIRSVITGQDPTTLAQTTAIETAPGAYSSDPGLSGAVAAHGTTGAIGQQIADDAMQGIGGSYVLGGAPGPHGKVHWDCSSMCNAVIGRDLGLAIPMYKPGAYHGQAHGPNTLVWIVWPGAFNIKRADAAAGDLAVWQTHM